MSSYATASDETLVNSYTTSDQASPAATPLVDGGWVVTWYGEGPGDGFFGIFQQRYAANGDTVGSETLVNTFITSYQTNPSTTMLSDGGWLVTWSGDGTGDGANGVFQRHFAANGDTVGSVTLVNSYTTDFQVFPTTTTLADGGWVVAWQGEGSGDSYGIFEQHYAANGDTIGVETRVNSYTTNDQTVPTIIDLADGGWVVAWQGEGTGDSSGIFQQRYAANGDVVGGEILVNSYTTNAQFAPKITTLADGGWVVAWYGYGEGDSTYGIFQQRYAANGQTSGSETLVNSYTTNNQINPSITALSDGGWVVTWEGYGPSGSDYSIFQQRYAANGDTVGSETLVNSYTTNSQINATATAMSDGGWIVTWEGEGTGDDHGIYQRHFAVDIDGTSGDNKLTGTVWGEYLIGYAGDDRLDGKGGNDILVGGKGNDTYVVDSKGDQVEELAGQGTDTVLASISYTLGGSEDNLTLTGKADLNATGNALANVLNGTSGKNTIKGLAGADIVTGGKGNDTLFGGTGGDHFIFKAGDDADKIMDFEAKGAAHDIIDLRHVSGLSDFADLKAHHMEQAGSSVVIDFTVHDSITLEGAKIKDLSAADFLF
jgi:Ca2+-binding RTX toxin-like protein